MHEKYIPIISSNALFVVALTMSNKQTGLNVFACGHNLTPVFI